MPRASVRAGPGLPQDHSHEEQRTGDDRIADLFDEVAEPLRAGQQQLGSHVAGQVDRGHALRTGQIAGQREGRIPARSDFEQALAGNRDACIGEAPDHDRPVLHLDVELAAEILQAAKAPLQMEVQQVAHRQTAEHLLHHPLDSPMHSFDVPS